MGSIKKFFQKIQNKVTPYGVGMLALAGSLAIGPYYAIPAIILSTIGIGGSVIWYSIAKNKEVAEKLEKLVDNNRGLKRRLQETEIGRNLLNEQDQEIVTLPGNEPTSTLRINGALNAVGAGILAAGTGLAYYYKRDNEGFWEGTFLDEIGAISSSITVVGLGINHFLAARKLRSYTDDLERTQTTLMNVDKTRLNILLQQAQQRSERLEEQFQEKQEGLNQLNTQLAQVQQQSDELNIEFQQSLQQVNELTIQLQDRQEESNHLYAELQQAQQQLIQLNAQFQDKQTESNQLREQLQTKQEKLDQLDKQFHQTQQKLTEIEQVQAKLQTTTEKEKQTDNQSTMNVLPDDAENNLPRKVM